MKLSRLSSFYLIITIVLLSCSSPPELPSDASFMVYGEVDYVPARGNIIFSKNDLEQRELISLDTIQINEDGKFKAVYDFEPFLYQIDFFGERQVDLVLDYGQKVKLNVDLKEEEQSVAVSGSPDTRLLQKYEEFRKKSLNKWVISVRKEIQRAKKNDNTEKVPQLVRKEVQNYKKHRVELSEWVAEKMDSSIAIYATSLRWEGEADLAVLKRIVNKVKEAHPNLSVTRKLERKLEKFQRIRMGAVAPDIALSNPQGEIVKLSSLRGNYVLLDFWAAWCAPCRFENEHYVKLYKKYHGEEFEIYAVSLDKNREQWLRAIEKDNITWITVSDLKGYDSEAAKLYNITALPVNFLLDKQGKIIDKDLRGKQLQDPLKKIFEQ